MPDVAQVVDRDAAHVHAHVVRLDRRERFDRPRQRVVDAQAHRRSAAGRRSRHGGEPAEAGGGIRGGPKTSPRPPSRATAAGTAGAELQSNQYSGGALEARCASSPMAAVQPRRSLMNCIRADRRPLCGRGCSAVATARARRRGWPRSTSSSRPARATEAMAKLDQFLAVKPKDPQLRFLKGVMLADSQAHGRGAWPSSLSLNEDYPELPEPYNNLAVLYAGQGDYDKARAALEAAVRGNPGYATAYENLGDVYAAAGRPGLCACARRSMQRTQRCRRRSRSCARCSRAKPAAARRHAGACREVRRLDATARRRRLEPQRRRRTRPLSLITQGVRMRSQFLTFGQARTLAALALALGAAHAGVGAEGQARHHRWATS